MSPPPFVLHVDETIDDLRTWRDEVNASGRVRLEVRHPDDVTAKDLVEARLVLVDFSLDPWKTRDNLKDDNGAAVGPSLKPPNGLALLPILQEHANALSKDQPRAFALYTGRVADIARDLIPRSHIVARAHNLEWVFGKTDGTNAWRVAKVTDLASAVAALPKPWPGESGDSAGKALRDWLGLPKDASWSDSAWRSILHCRPPIHQFAEHTHGIGVLRWMLHKILPYPCFLLDDAHVAARLRVTVASFREALAAGGPLATLLRSAEYTGQLGTFLERRWWRSALDSIVFELAKDDPSSLALLHKALTERAPKLEVVDAESLFPVVDAAYRVTDVLALPKDVVEIVPDDWPPFADSAWALRSEVESADALKSIVASDASLG